MLVWNIQVEGECRQDFERAYAVWSDLSRWPEWDHDIEWARLHGDFHVNAKGTIKLRTMQPVGFRVAFAEKNRRFSIVIKKKLTTIAVTCEIVKISDKKTGLRLRIIVGGMLAPFYKRTWGKKLQKSLPQVMDRLTHIIAT